MNPRFPIFIPSKGRAKTSYTARAFDAIGVPYRLVVEEPEVEDYRAYFPSEKLIVLDPEYQSVYPTLDADPDPTLGKGSGPARNFIWDLSISEGQSWHWIIDDNIKYFARLHDNQRIQVGDGTMFHAMETFGLRYKNTAMLGPHYRFFAPSRSKRPPFITGSRVYSCILIRNSIPFRWRGRYNEDTILSLDVLKAGWATVLFFAYLQEKSTTQMVPGGNTDALYRPRGTLPKSQMLVREHPDVSRLTWRFGRWHHHVDYRRFRNQHLIRDPEFTERYEYDLQLRDGRWDETLDKRTNIRYDKGVSRQGGE